jgi:hypothetical protein
VVGVSPRRRRTFWNALRLRCFSEAGVVSWAGPLQPSSLNPVTYRLLHIDWTKLEKKIEKKFNLIGI